MSTISPSPNEAGTTAAKWEGWWMLVIPPLTLGVHALCSYYSAWTYCKMASEGESDSLSGMGNIYTLVAMVLLLGMAFWGYLRYCTSDDVKSPRLQGRIAEVRNLGLTTIILSAVCAAGVAAIATFLNTTDMCG